MRSHFASLIALAGTTITQIKADPTPPRLVYLLTAHIEIGEGLSIGPVAGGNRTAYGVTGGTFEGPLLKGTVVGGVGGDFALISDDNLFSPGGTAFFKTDDGAAILFTTAGHQNGTSLFASVTFQAGAEKYSWLNNVVALSRATVDFGDTNSSAGVDFFVVSGEDA